VGSSPRWISDDQLVDTTLLRCTHCDKQLAFVMQAFNDDCTGVDVNDESVRTRPRNCLKCLFVFACNSEECVLRPTWRVLRAMKFVDNDAPLETKLIAKPVVKVDNDTNWGVADKDDWGDAADDVDTIGTAGTSTALAAPQSDHLSSSPAASFWQSAPAVIRKADTANALSASTAEMTAVGAVAFVKETFDAFYIEVDYEPEKETSTAAELDDEAVERVMSEQRANDDPECDVDAAANEPYEAADAFSKFRRRLARAPAQLLRHGTEPLWPSKEQRIARVPPCARCGARRAFELQLLPTLLLYLQPGDVRMPGFGSVFVFTCTDNCVASAANSVTEEFVVVHPEL
jgi:hypothetical protein